MEGGVPRCQARNCRRFASTRGETGLIRAAGSFALAPRFRAWPYRLLTKCAGEAAHPPLRHPLLECVQEFWDAPACCLDSAFSEPLRKSASSPEDLDTPHFRALLQQLRRKVAKASGGFQLSSGCVVGAFPKRSGMVRRGPPEAGPRRFPRGRQ